MSTITDTTTADDVEADDVYRSHHLGHVVTGHRVLADEPAPANALFGDGNVKYRQIRELLLDDGSTTFGCGHCEFTGGSIMSIRSHLKKHRAPKAEQPEPISATLHDLAREVTRLSEALEQEQAKRKDAERRARDAEKRLATLRKALS